MNFFKPWKLRLQQLIILVLHLVLLKWMHFTLYDLGSTSMNTMFGHFLGMSLFGGLLIFGTAQWAKRRYLKENNLTHLPK